MSLKNRDKAILVLADGSVFEGVSIGATGSSVGEVVFNTAMTGYQEILTDPSYAKQIITLTYPHIGNVGVNQQDAESKKHYCTGLVIKDLPRIASNFRSEQALDEYLVANNTLGIAGIDTRQLTVLLRETGAQNACLMAGDINLDQDVATALENARSFSGLKGQDLAKEVTCDSSYSFEQGVWALGSGFASAVATTKKVVAYDFGVKQNILRLLVDRGCEVVVVPATTSAEAVLAMKPDGVFLSNGPGDPEPCDYAIKAIQDLLDVSMPIFGICLGHQLLALASGATTEKMKFGHHGANHPVLDIDSGKVLITSQNHGFSVAEQGLPSHLRVTHSSLFDQSIQGIEHTEKPAFGFQGHPEASPGPKEAEALFDRFMALMGDN